MPRQRQNRLPSASSTRPAATSDRPTQESCLALVHQLVTELGAARLLHLIADVAAERASDAVRQGASPQTARVSREAALLRRAADEILD